MKKKPQRFLATLLFGALLPSAAVIAKDATDPPAQITPPLVTDLFGRDVTAWGLTLPDWEGYMANPAIQFTVSPPPQARFPLTVSLSTQEQRIYFDLPSSTNERGAQKTLVFPDAKPQSVYIAAFPARQKQALEATLKISFLDPNGQRSATSIPLHIVPIESEDRSANLPIRVDFSHDTTGFYQDEAHRASFMQAVADWDFYLKDMQLEAVSPHEERTIIFEPSGFESANVVTNDAGYTGFLLYTYGIKGPELRSGGEPSPVGGFQRNGKGDLPMRRSGGVETEIDGNYNTLGWMPASLPDSQWWRATNLGDVPNDLYSIMHHEMGHTLFFNPNNRSFIRKGVLKDAAVRAYIGSDIATDRSDHFDGFIDPVSLHGAFGNEYHGKTPYGRWLITKLDLLCIQALGYQLRPVAPLLPLSIQTEQIPDATLQAPYDVKLSAQGGVPVYDWQVESGALPPGLELNRFTGQITGMAKRAGQYAFAIKVREYDRARPGVIRPFQISVSNSAASTH